jgi:hypothetical protein
MEIKYFKDAISGLEGAKMSTPPRLVEIECPTCNRSHWEIDCDYRGIEPDAGYPDRLYKCPKCGAKSSGWRVKQKSPPEFLLQPHDLYPMTHGDFNHWVAVLKANFPRHPAIKRLGDDFYPRTPEEAQERKPAVLQMRDQDNSLRIFPESDDVEEWIELMEKETDFLRFLHKDGGELLVFGQASGPFEMSCMDAQGGTIAKCKGVDKEHVLDIIGEYLSGHISDCTGMIRKFALKILG